MRKHKFPIPLQRDFTRVKGYSKIKLLLPIIDLAVASISQVEVEVEEDVVVAEEVEVEAKRNPHHQQKTSIKNSTLISNLDRLIIYERISHCIFDI